MAGVNQTLMMSLSMVVVASMIDVGGLGQMVLRGIGRLDMGTAAVGGIGIVVQAIVLDRNTQALPGNRATRTVPWHQRGPVGAACAALASLGGRCGRARSRRLQVPASRNADETREVRMSGPAIECKSVWKIFGHRPREALELVQTKGIDKDELFRRTGCVIGVADVSFRVNRGKIFCVMGLSGSGKSTQVRHISRLIEPAAGSIIIGGQDINALNKADLRRMRPRRSAWCSSTWRSCRTARSGTMSAWASSCPGSIL